MIDALIRWSLRNRAAVLAAVLALSVLGAWRAASLPVDVFPDLTAPTVTVLTEVHGMAPAEVEAQVTFPIESALNGAPGVRRVRSSTALGLSIVWAEFDWGENIFHARQIVAEKAATVAGTLPPEAGAPVLAPTASIMGEIMFLALASDTQDPVVLRTFAEQTARRRLLAVPGVAQVTVLGGGLKQYQVRLDTAQLAALGVSLDEVADALAASNENTAAGVTNEGGSELLVQGIGRLRTVEDIAAVVVRREHESSLTVGDLGEVVVGEAPKRGEGSANGSPAVVFGVQKQPGANTLTVTAAMDQVLDDLEDELPEGARLDRFVFRQADFIEVAIDNVREALRDGALLVVLIMLMFLADVRASLITLTAIPISLLVSALVLEALGASVNTMTLGGMAIAIGALVDDAVIDVENVYRRLRENAARPPEQRRGSLAVVRDASLEIRSSIVFATLIIVLVFVPLFFLSGVEGRLLHPLGLAYVVALLTSLVVAVTATPALCHLLLPGSRGVQRGTEPLLVRGLRRVYTRVLSPALSHPWFVLLPAVLLLGLAISAVPHMGRAFLPEFNEGALTISAVTLPGTSLPESDRLGRVVEELILRQPEVASVTRRTGRAELDEHAQGVEAAELEVTFTLAERSKEQFLAALREDLTLVPGTAITIGQPISHRIDHMLSGTRASVAVKLFGPDLHELRRLAGTVREAMAPVEGVVDLAIDGQADIPLLQAQLDRAALARHGVPVREVSHTLEAAFSGMPVTQLLEGRYGYDVVLRLDEPGTWNAERLRELPVDVPGGATVPLGSLAHVRPFTGPNRISREAVERKLVVSCNVAGRDLGSVVAAIADAVDPIVDDSPGYRVAYGGQFESAQEATTTLAWLSVAVILGIGFLLNMAFGSVRDALLVMANLPLALIGGVAGVFLAGGILSVASVIGFITVFGIATRNGIMLVSHVRHLQREEQVTDFREAVRRGAEERLAAILMTALGTALALVPLALAAGEPGNEIQAPMAVVILCGLTSSMFLNMLVVPVLVLHFGRAEPPAVPSLRELAS
jgi:CzcA family heavy metal efflux pump